MSKGNLRRMSENSKCDARIIDFNFKLKAFRQVQVCITNGPLFRTIGTSMCAFLFFERPNTIAHILCRQNVYTNSAVSCVFTHCLAIRSFRMGANNKWWRKTNVKHAKVQLSRNSVSISLVSYVCVCGWQPWVFVCLLLISWYICRYLIARNSPP